MTFAMLHVIVLLAALSATAHRPQVFVPLTAREPVVRRLPTSSVDAVQVAAGDVTSEGAGGGDCFAELRFEVQKR